MSDIAAILQQLPDDAARMRVMRWAFGRFSTEFKRPVSGALTDATPATARPVVAAPTAPPPVETTRAATGENPADFGEQLSELTDLFPERPIEAIDEAADLWPA